MQPEARGSYVTFFFFVFLSFFLGRYKCADAKGVVPGKLGWPGGGYTFSKHSEAIHTLIGIIFSGDMPWCICCLGLEQKSHHTLQTGSSCALAFSSGRDWTSTCSLSAKIMVCIWGATRQIFLFPWQLALYKGERKGLVLFWKIRHVQQQDPKQSKVQLHIFFPGFRKKSMSLFYWAFSTSRLEASQCAEECGWEDTTADKDSPHLSSFRLWI